MARGHRIPTRARRLILVLAVALGATACAHGIDPASGDDLFPDVIAAVATPADDGSWSFDVTLSSPYDSPDRYADAWRVVAPDGAELAVRELLHDHANEQPFTRSLAGVAVPPGVAEVTIEGRDQRNGWGGATVVVALD